MKRVAAITATALSMCLSLLLFAGCVQSQGSASSSASSETGQQNTVPLTNKAFQVGEIAHENASLSSSVTILVYMNGSDLESVDGEATIDIAEMLESGIGENANVIIETVGTSEWQKYGIASDHSQRYAVKKGKLELVDDTLGQLDTTDPETLSDFIRWGAENYPAQRYMLLLWDHGAGPVWGFGYDEFQSDYSALTLDEMQAALAANSGVHFDMIGMDCCLMSSLEVCCVLAPYCDYAVLSEDFEPGVGWSYENWMSMLEDDPSMPTLELGTQIVDDMIAAVEENKQNGDATLALIDESVAPLLYSTWVDFAYENQDALLGTNYSQETMQRGRQRPGGMGQGGPGGHEGPGDHAGWGESPGGSGGFDSWGYDTSYVTMSDYYVTDIMAVASSLETDSSKALESALSNAVVHFGCTSGEVGMTGMGVTLPYGDAEFYDELVEVFTACGFDDTYIEWLEAFVDAEGVDSYYDYESFEDMWSGWETFYDGYSWHDWIELNEELWQQYESYGWYDGWYDGQDDGWYGFFYDDGRTGQSQGRR